MNLVLVGGYGIESDFLHILALGKFKGSYIRLIGGRFDLASNAFPDYSGRVNDFQPQYLTPKNVSDLNDSRFIFDISESMRSKYIVNDAALRLKIPALYSLPVPEWGIFYHHPQSGCLSCFREYIHPVPPVSQPVPAFLDLISPYLSDKEFPAQSFFLDAQGNIRYVEKNPSCPVCGNLNEFTGGRDSFYYGENGDMVSLSCDNQSVGITPTNDVSIDLSVHRQLIDGYCTIKETSPFFLQFTIEGFTATLFRQGRLTVSPTKDESPALCIYRWFVGN